MRQIVFRAILALSSLSKHIDVLPVHDLVREPIILVNSTKFLLGFLFSPVSITCITWTLLQTTKHLLNFL